MVASLYALCNVSYPQLVALLRTSCHHEEVPNKRRVCAIRAVERWKHQWASQRRESHLKLHIFRQRQNNPLLHSRVAACSPWNPVVLLQTKFALQKQRRTQHWHYANATNTKIRGCVQWGRLCSKIGHAHRHCQRYQGCYLHSCAQTL